MSVQQTSDLISHPLWFGVALALAGALAGFFLYRWHISAPLRALLTGFLDDTTNVVFFLRGLFVPGEEYFSRAPADPRTPATGLTVLKWNKVPEVYVAAEVQAIADLFHLLIVANQDVGLTLLSGEPTRQAWSDHAIAVGPHYKALQILDACEPRLIAVRQPAAFRNLVTQEVFEPKDGRDFGLIYKGRHPGSHKTFWVVMGLSDQATVTAARFLRVNARSLGYLVGGKPFAGIISMEPAKGWDHSTLRSLQPPPAWWRRLLYRSHWRRLTTAPGAKPV